MPPHPQPPRAGRIGYRQQPNTEHSETCVDGARSREVEHLERVRLCKSSRKQSVSHSRESTDVEKGNTQCNVDRGAHGFVLSLHLFLTHCTIPWLPGPTDNISQRETLRHRLFPFSTLARKYHSIFSFAFFFFLIFKMVEKH